MQFYSFPFFAILVNFIVATTVSGQILPPSISHTQCFSPCTSTDAYIPRGPYAKFIKPTKAMQCEFESWRHIGKQDKLIKLGNIGKNWSIFIPEINGSISGGLSDKGVLFIQAKSGFGQDRKTYAVGLKNSSHTKWYYINGDSSCQLGEGKIVHLDFEYFTGVTVVVK